MVFDKVGSLTQVFIVTVSVDVTLYDKILVAWKLYQNKNITSFGLMQDCSFSSALDDAVLH